MENIEGNSIGEMVINVTNILKEIGVNKDEVIDITMSILTNYNIYGKENNNRVENLKNLLYNKLNINDYISVTQYKNI
tara:strand:+ start:246 stop:479 length:234 start_codon:yes stop_codon:yes gene_type:complete